MNPWILLAAAIASELVASTMLRFSRGFTRALPTVVMGLGYGLSFFLMSRALLEIPLGLAYAIWSGVGVAGTALLARALFGEALTRERLSGLALIIAGTVALNLEGVVKGGA